MTRAPKPRTPLAEILKRWREMPPPAPIYLSDMASAEWALFGSPHHYDEEEESPGPAEVFNQWLYDTGHPVLGPDGYIRTRTTGEDGSVFHDSIHVDEWVRAHVAATEE